MSGWIKLHRSIKDWEWYDDVNVRLTFLHCLVEANFKDGRFKGTSFPRGSFPCGREQLAESVGISIQQLRTALSKLESTGEITIKSTSKGMTLTICNYETYQHVDLGDQPASNQQVTSDQPASNHSIRKKEGKKERVFTPPSLEEFIEYLLIELPIMNPDWMPEQIARAATAQFSTYTEQGWKDGNGKQILIWKTKAKNAMSYKKPWNFGQVKPKTEIKYGI